MAWTLPPDRPVLEEEPAAAVKLIASGGQYRPPPKPYFSPEWYRQRPPGWQCPATYFCPELADIGLTRLTQDKAGGVAFIHRRRSRGGVERLVVVEYSQTALGPRGHLTAIYAENFTPAGWHPGEVAGKSGSVGVVDLWPGPLPLTLFAGQADPSDDSHFTIAFAAGGARGRIDGWLKDKGAMAEAPRSKPLEETEAELKVTEMPAGLGDRDAFQRANLMSLRK